MEVDETIKSEITLDCTWDIDGGCPKALEKLLKFSSSESPELEDVVQAETCVHLCSGDGNVPCSFHIKLSSQTQYVISKVTVVSEARIIECYGHCKEYYRTFESDFLDDFEGCAAYIASSEVLPADEITLKFARMKHENRMWLYGVHLTVSKVSSPQVRLGSINFSNVNEILKESSRPISDKAEQCKKFLQQSIAPNGRGGRCDVQAVLKMLEGEYLKPLGDTGRSMTRLLSSVFPHLMSKRGDPTGIASKLSQIQIEDSDKPPREQQPSMSGSKPESCYCDRTKDLKEYIDQRFGELEVMTRRLEQTVKEMEKSQNEKLDTIIRLLQANQKF